MLIGSINITQKAIITHRDSYLISNLSVISTRRPFLGSAFMLGGAFIAFGLAFSDLLYMNEIAAILIASSVAIIAGLNIGQLKLLSRDLRGSEISGAIFGSYSELNHIRSKIIQQINDLDQEVSK